MTVQEMLMDEDVPPDLIVEKLKEVKVNYVSPDADLSQTQKFMKNTFHEQDFNKSSPQLVIHSESSSEEDEEYEENESS